MKIKVDTGEIGVYCLVSVNEEKQMNGEYKDLELAKSAIKNGKLLIRGDRPWDLREQQRKDAGCGTLSFGGITASNLTLGKSSLER